jgi:hypothetical protein
MGLPLGAILKPVAKKLLIDKAFREIKKRTTHDEVVETLEEIAVRELEQGEDSQPPLVFNKAKAKTRGGTIIVALGTLGIGIAVQQGWISPEVGELLNESLNSEAGKAAADCLADSSTCGGDVPTSGQ